MRFLIPLSGLAIFSFAAFLAIKSGGFKSVDITLGTQPALILLESEHTGPYHETVKSIEHVEKFAQKNSLDCRESFGEYVDDPNVVEHERLKSYAGCILKEEPQGLTYPPEFKIRKTEEKKVVIAHFAGSPAIGPYKVYGKVADYMKENRLTSAGPVMEKYLIENGKMTTTYVFPVK